MTEWGNIKGSWKADDSRWGRERDELRTALAEAVERCRRFEGAQSCDAQEIAELRSDLAEAVEIIRASRQPVFWSAGYEDILSRLDAFLKKHETKEKP